MKKCLLLIFILIAIENNGFAQRILKLYKDSISGTTTRLTDADSPTLTAFLPTKHNATGTAIIIFPGGGYGFLAFSEEGVSIAKTFATMGIAAFVVRYTLPTNVNNENRSLAPLKDAQQAIKTIRERAEEWDISPNKIGVLGFSAGGHLASTLGTHYDINYIPNAEKISLRPNFMILVYPVISMDNSLVHRGSRINLLGVSPTADKVAFFSNEEQVNKETPPTYLTHTGDDEVVDVNNSIVFYQALQKNGVEAELHLYPKGNHGFTQRLPTNEWLNPMLCFLKREGFYKPN